MSWPYHFIDLSQEQKVDRRHLLDTYGSYAQLSAFVPVLIYQLFRLIVWVSNARNQRNAGYAAVPSSPTLKSERLSSTGVVATRWRQLQWWFGKDLMKGWGTRTQWMAGSLWTAWLMFLTFHRTGEDYMHLTKRFGIIAASQFPVHYMLSMKSPYSPMAIAFRASHEELNPWHRLLGRLIYLFLLLHGIFYFNYFIQITVLWKRLRDWDVIFGLSALSLFTILMSTALQRVRQYSYRVFFICHLIIGVIAMPILFFHVTHLRLYVIESLALVILDLIGRKLDTFTAFTRIIQIPNTTLIKLIVPVPISKIGRFRCAAGQHVYLSIPTASAKNPIHQLLYNPFTIAEVSTEHNTATVVLRVLNGPTTAALQRLIKLPKANPPLNIEGPYGSSRKFPNLAQDFDRILLIAGGVGATYTMPIYKELQALLAPEGKSTGKLKVVWAMRAVDEALWASDDGKIGMLETDVSVDLYVTGGESTTSSSGQYDGDVEMEPVKEENGRKFRSGRPDLRKLVDETFKHGDEERVAILVCGPEGMAREVKNRTDTWVGKGRIVWFHDESFGW